MARQTQILQTKIADTEKLIKQMDAEGKTAQIPQVSANLQNLITETEDLYKKSSEMSKVTTPNIPLTKEKAEVKPQILVSQQPANPAKVTVVENIIPKQTNIVLTSTPNVINGIVSDPAGNFLENVIVIIHNKEGIPVRALKTNKLGQFVGSTPLPSGIYTVTLEKEGYSFQTLEITLENQALAPIKISPAGGKA